MDEAEAQMRERKKKHWALRPQKPLGLIKDGEVRGSGKLKMRDRGACTKYQVKSGRRGRSNS